LSGLHWRTIKINIDYENRTADILFDDPYGHGRFPENLKLTIYPIIKSNIEKLIKIQVQDDSFNLISEIPTYEKAHDQQGHGENSWDCGPITFSNIEDYIKVSVSITEQMIYSIPTYTNLQHSTKIAEIRINDIKRYSEITQLPIDPTRLNEIRQQLEEVRETQVQKIQELVPEVNITELEPFYISMLFEILENKRLFEGEDITKEYTKEELSYAYQVVLSEMLTGKDFAFSASIINNKKETMKEQYNKEKLEEDLTKLIEANSLIDQSISALEDPSFDTTAFLGYLEQIGQLIHDISWKEDNHNCIRNKHGYRNRHKDEGNNKNKKGAKLDFETLGHLKDLAVDEDFQYLLTTDLEKTKSSLQVLQTKVNFIISKEHSHLSQEQQSQITYTKEDSHDKDVGFLRQASAYYHDTRCINKLLSLIEDTNPSNAYAYLDLSNKVDKYWLGYFFVQIGETAKELSEFIKPELDSKDAENNIIRFLFGKLGHYRQKIKGSPQIIYDEKDNKLLEVQKKFEEAKHELKVLLQEIQKLLVGKFNDITQIDYNKISWELQDDVTPEFIKNLTNKLSLNDVLKRKSRIKEEKSEALQHEIDELKRMKEEFEKQKEALKNTDTFSISSEAMQASKEDFTKNKNTIPLINILEKYLKLHSETNTQSVKDLIDILAKESQTKTSSDKLGKEQYDLLTLTKGLHTKFTAIAKLVTEEIEQLSVSNFLELLKDFNINPKAAKANSDNTKSKEQSLNSKIARTEKQIHKKEEEKTKLDREIASKAHEKAIKTLKKITHEMQNLTEIEESGDSEKISYSRKMSIGFLGQYLKEIFQGEYSAYTDEILKQDFLFNESMASAINTRHKYSMHGMFNSYIDVDYKLQTTVFSDIFPWEENIFALIFLTYEKLGHADKILDTFPQELLVNFTENERELLVLHILIQSNIRLQNYSQIREYFTNSQARIDKYIIEGTAEETKRAVGLYLDYFSCLKICGRVEDAKEIALSCLKLTEDLSGLEDLRELLQAGLLLISPELCFSFSHSVFKNPDHLLCLVDAYLECNETEESYKLIHIIGNSLQNSTIHQAYNHSHICAKYYRVLGSNLLQKELSKMKTSAGTIILDFSSIFDSFQKEEKWLNSCEQTLIGNENQFKTEIGTRYNNHLFIIKAEKAWNQLQLPHTIKLFAANQAAFDLKTHFLNAIKYAGEAIEIYQQCSTDTDQGKLAGMYLCRGIARQNLEGQNSDNARANFELAKQIYDKLPQLQKSAKDVEQINLLASKFEELKDKANYESCKKMAEENPYYQDQVEKYQANLTGEDADGGGS